MRREDQIQDLLIMQQRLEERLDGIEKRLKNLEELLLKPNGAVGRIYWVVGLLVGLSIAVNLLANFGRIFVQN